MTVITCQNHHRPTNLITLSWRPVSHIYWHTTFLFSFFLFLFQCNSNSAENSVKQAIHLFVWCLLFCNDSDQNKALRKTAPKTVSLLQWTPCHQEWRSSSVKCFLLKVQILGNTLNATTVLPQLNCMAKANWFGMNAVADLVCLVCLFKHFYEI